MLPSQWHYAVCNFTDGGSARPADASSTATEIRYTIRSEDKDKRLYLASSRAGACSKGQRILIRLPCPAEYGCGVRWCTIVMMMHDLEQLASPAHSRTHGATGTQRGRFQAGHSG